MTIEYRTELPGTSACFQLFMSTGWNDVYRLSEDEYIEAIRGSWHLVGAYDGERLVGLGRVISDGVLYALIVDVVVIPDYRGRRIGARIMEQLLERCRAGHIRDVKLFAAKGKAAFYKRYGFAERPADAPGMGLRDLHA